VYILVAFLKSPVESLQL